MITATTIHGSTIEILDSVETENGITYFGVLAGTTHHGAWHETELTPRRPARRGAVILAHGVSFVPVEDLARAVAPTLAR